VNINPLNAELNPICHLLALLGGATIVVVSRLRVNIRDNSILCHSDFLVCYVSVKHLCIFKVQNTLCYKQVLLNNYVQVLHIIYKGVTYMKYWYMEERDMNVYLYEMLYT
jgi:hypothetical protein